jgi:hypothetical protein
LAVIALGGVLGVGCARVLGLDEVPDPPVPNHFTVDYTLRAVANTPTGIGITDALYDPSAFIVRTPSGTPAVTRTGPGTYEFDSLDASYEIQLVPAQATYPSRVQHDARELHLLQTQLSRPDAVQPVNAVTLDVSGIPVTSGTSDWHLSSTGVWADASLSNGLGGRKGSMDWRDTKAGLVDAAAGDRLYYLEYVYDLATGFGRAVGYLALDVQMQEGTNNLGTGTPQQITLRGARIVADGVQGTSRFDPTLVPGGTKTKITVAVVAVPGDVLTAPGGIPLTATATTTPIMFDGAVRFGNVIAGTQSTAIGSLSSTRSVVAPGAVFGQSFDSAIVSVAPPYSATGSDGESATVSTTNVGVISAVQIGDALLTADNTTYTATSADNVVVSWTVASGTFDYYAVQLVEISNINGFTYPVYVDTIETVVPQATLSASVLRTGHTYMFSITGVLGAPMAGQGDFRMTTSSGGFEVFVPGTFTVALPPPPT